MHTIKHIEGFYNTTNTYHSLLRVYYENMKTITYLHRRIEIKQVNPQSLVLSSSLYRFSLSLLVLSVFLFKPSFFYPN